MSWRLVVRLLVLLAVTGLFAGTSWFLWHWFRVPSFAGPPPAPLPKLIVEDGRPTIHMPNGNLLLHAGTYNNEMTAWLHYEYLQSLPMLHGAPELLTSHEEADSAVYDLYVAMPNDLLAAGQLAGALEAARFINPGSYFLSPPRSQIDEWDQQTAIYRAAYNAPVEERLRSLPKKELTSAVARFILFKSRTDRRVRKQMDVVADQDISLDHSLEFAADMIAVAHFYQLPLDMLLGMGAMENNYLDVRGDLKHASWKHHAQKGDLVLRRGKRGVLVSNFAVGPWQITRETLRYAYRLCRTDKRDYNTLPKRLRPPGELDLAHVTTAQLTLYAGSLLRDLLDHFHGDVAKAIGAYNGGPGHPNLQYFEGVNTVAEYAHRVVSLAAGRKGNAVHQVKLQTRDEPLREARVSLPDSTHAAPLP